MEYKFKRIIPTSKTDSAMINRGNQDISTDLYELHMSSLQNSAIMEAEQLANNDTMNMLLAKVHQLSGQLAALDTTKTMFTAFDNNAITFPSSLSDTGKATVYNDYGQITLPILENDTQLMVLNQDTGELSLRDDAEDFVSEYLTNNKYTDRVDAVFQNSVISALNTNMADPFYVRCMSSNTNITFIEDVITVALPVPTEINTIRLIPLPEYGVTIDNIVQTADAGTFDIKDIYGNMVEFPYTQATRQIFHMPTYNTSEISVKISQPNYTMVNGSKEFRLGVRHLSIEFNVYANAGYFMLTVPYDASHQYLRQISMDWDADENSKVYLYDSIDEANALSDNYIFQGTGAAILPNIPLLMNNQNYYIVVELRPINVTDATPVFRGCTVNRIDHV
jgi:hypothetical protein